MLKSVKEACRNSSAWLCDPGMVTLVLTKTGRAACECCLVRQEATVYWASTVDQELHTIAVQSLSRVWLFMTPWAAACRASLSFTISLSLLKFMSIESVMPSNHLILCHHLLPHHQSFPASGPFSMSRFFTSGKQSIRVSAATSVLPMNIQGWYPLGLTGLISLLSKGLSSVFSSTTVQKHQLFGAQPSLSNMNIPTWLLKKP